MSPTIVATPLPDQAGIRLQLDGWVANNARWPGITRIDANGVGLVRTIEGQEPTGGAMVITDFEPALVGPVTYEVNWGGQYIRTTVTLDGQVPRPVISLAQFPRQRIMPEVIKTFGWTRSTRSVVHDGGQRVFPLVSLGELGGRTSTMQVRTMSVDEARAIEALLSTPHIALLRQPTHRGLDHYFVPTTVTVSLNGEYKGFLVDVEAVEQPAPIGPVIGTLGWDINAVVGSYPSIMATRAAYPDIAALAIGPDA